MVQYDPKVIQEFAERLYSRAKAIVVVAAVLGAIVGFPAGIWLSIAMTRSPSIPAGFVGCVLGGLLGYVIGTQRAFLLRLQAQQALCQVEIERNTRVPRS